MPVIERHLSKANLVTLETSFVDRHLVRELPGVRYDKDSRNWTAPLSWGTCVAARGLFKDQLIIGPELTSWARKERERRIDPCLRLRMLSEPADELQHDEDLYPFQQVGVRFLATAGSALLADGMGSGKSAQVIRALRRMQHNGDPVFPALIACPNSLKYHWEQEFKKWWPGLDITVIGGGIAARRKLLAENSQVFILNYEVLRFHSRLQGYGSVRLKRCIVCDPDLPNTTENAHAKCEHCPRELNDVGWRTVVCDEAHRLKDPKAKQTRAVWALGRQATNRFALTGTPIANNPSELWSILHFLAPDEHPVRSKFIDRYCDVMFNPFGGMEMLGLRANTRQEFFAIVDPRFRRLPQEVILKHLPPMIYSERYVEMTPKQRTAYLQMEKRMAARIDTEILLAPSPLLRLIRLLQLASAYATVSNTPATFDQEGSTEVTLTDPSNKVDALIELLDEMGDEPLVVFSASKQLINLAAARMTRLGITHGLMTGDQKPYERQQAVQDFQAGRVRVFAGTISVAGEGITLTRSRRVAFLSRHWSAVMNAQAEKRCHRIGSEIHDFVEIIDFISPDTAESRQRELLGTKLERLEEVVRDKATLEYLLGV